MPQVHCSQCVTALQCLWLIPQVLNSYGKVFPTQPPSGRPVREAVPQGPSWERHIDEHDPENPPDRLERKNSVGNPAWCHSDSRRKLQLEQVQLEALAGGSSAGATTLPAASDYERRKQERLQAIRSVQCPGGICLAQLPGLDASHGTAIFLDWCIDQSRQQGKCKLQCYQNTSAHAPHISNCTPSGSRL